MVDWSDLEAGIDAAVFTHLSDDPLGIWTRGETVIGSVAVILDRVEMATGRHGGMALLDMADVARLSVGELIGSGIAEEPAAGDVLSVKGRPYVIHGQPWRDEKVNGRDWLCPVNR